MSIQLKDAIRIVEENLRTSQFVLDLVIQHDNTIEKDDYWVFFYDSAKYIETEDFSYVIAGNAPLIVDKFEGKIYQTGTANPIEHYIELFERNELPQIKSRIK
jgi:hypothetical protein